jgi:chemotaxis receptor (MCP) glutamine deamidase CheD
LRKVINKIGKKNVKNIEQVLKLFGIELSLKEIENQEFDEYKQS